MWKTPDTESGIPSFVFDGIKGNNGKWDFTRFFGNKVKIEDDAPGLLRSAKNKMFPKRNDMFDPNTVEGKDNLRLLEYIRNTADRIPGLTSNLEFNMGMGWRDNYINSYRLKKWDAKPYMTKKDLYQLAMDKAAAEASSTDATISSEGQAMLSMLKGTPIGRSLTPRTPSTTLTPGSTVASGSTPIGGAPSIPVVPTTPSTSGTSVPTPKPASTRNKPAAKPKSKTKQKKKNSRKHRLGGRLEQLKALRMGFTADDSYTSNELSKFANGGIVKAQDGSIADWYKNRYNYQ